MARIPVYPVPEPIPVCEPGSSVALTEPGVPAVAEQFGQLGRIGDYLAAWPADGIRSFRYADVDDENRHGFQNHFQGMERLRSGAYAVISGGDPYEPASHLFVVQMGSRQVEGGWGSNVLRAPEPPPHDRVVRTIAIDPTFWHAGGMSTQGDVLAVPLENSGAGQSRVVFYNMRVPEDPCVFAHRIDRPDFKAGAVALTRLPSGRFLAAVWTDSDPAEPKKHLDLYVSHGPDFFQGFRNPPTVCVDEVATLGKYQTVAFVWQTDGQLFLVGFENSASLAPLQPGVDSAQLLRVTFPDDFLIGGTDTVPKPVIEPVSRQEFSCPDRQCNMDGATGLHIGTGGRMTVYSAAHYLHRTRFWSFPRKLVIKFNEFRPTEGSALPTVERIEDAWIELFDRTAYRGRHLSLFGPGDARIEHYRKIRVQGGKFGDGVRSARFQIPEGFAYVLHQKPHFRGGRPLVLQGIGKPLAIPDFAAHGFDNLTKSSRYETPLVARTSAEATIVTA